MYQPAFLKVTCDNCGDTYILPVICEGRDPATNDYLLTFRSQSQAQIAKSNCCMFCDISYHLPTPEVDDHLLESNPPLVPSLN